jgi:hypothetical protein
MKSMMLSGNPQNPVFLYRNHYRKTTYRDAKVMNGILYIVINGLIPKLNMGSVLKVL